MSGFGEDSGRKIAIDLIKSNLKKLIEKKKLIEDKYLLCERVTSCQRKLKAIRNIDDLSQMQLIVDEMINNVLEKIRM